MVRCDTEDCTRHQMVYRSAPLYLFDKLEFEILFFNYHIFSKVYYNIHLV